jgi:hypothetical protein
MQWLACIGLAPALPLVIEGSGAGGRRRREERYEITRCGGGRGGPGRAIVQAQETRAPGSDR